MDLKKAYELLTISDDATLEQLEEKYYFIIRREKNRRDKAHIEQTKSEVDLDEINEAYRIAKTHILGEDDPSHPINQEEPVTSKIDHFFRYYKIHTIVAIVSIIVLWSTVSFVMDRIEDSKQEATLGPVDLNLMLMGEYETDDLTPLKENIAETFPEWNHTKVDLIYAPNEPRDQQDYASIIKNQAILTEANPDLLIIDRNQYNLYVGDGSFLPLDEHINIDQIENNQLLYYQTEEDENEKIYGVEISNSTIFEGVAIEGEKIAVIRPMSRTQENSIEFINRVAK